MRFRAVDKKNFDEVRHGLKIVETRAATPRYAAIEKGDVLVFVCGKERLEKKIKKVRQFGTISMMLRSISPSKIMPSAPSLKEMEKIYWSYSGYKEKIKKFGLVAFYI